MDMDMLVEEEDSPYVQEASSSPTWSYWMLNPMIYINYLLQFLEAYGWLVLFGVVVSCYLVRLLHKRYKQLQQKWEDAEYHKDPDKAMARMQAIERVREQQQRRLEEASQRAREELLEREERRRAEALERLQRYGGGAGAAADAGRRLGGGDDYLPLSGGGPSASSYRPPKRSKCGGGGCGQ